MAPALRMTRSIKEKLPFFSLLYLARSPDISTMCVSRVRIPQVSTMFWRFFLLLDPSFCGREHQHHRLANYFVYLQHSLSGLGERQIKSAKNGSFSLIERVILSAGAMLIFSVEVRRCAAGTQQHLGSVRALSSHS